MTVAAICEKLGMSRQNYYKARRVRQRREIDEEAITALVRAERQIQPRLGARKVLKVLERELTTMGIGIGRDRFLALLRRHNMLVAPKTRRPRTTQRDWRYPVEPNRLKGMEVTEPNQAYAADVTYMYTREGWRYLSLLTDVCSRKIVGWALWESLQLEGPLAALDMALGQLPPGSTPLHHSDRGSQYTSTPYREALAAAGWTVSMTEENHCYENALAERVNGILKQEYGLSEEFASTAHARRAVAQAVALYNTRRPHTSLGYRTPDAVHRVA